MRWVMKEVENGYTVKMKCWHLRAKDNSCPGKSMHGGVGELG